MQTFMTHHKNKITRTRQHPVKGSLLSRRPLFLCMSLLLTVLISFQKLNARTAVDTTSFSSEKLEQISFVINRLDSLQVKSSEGSGFLAGSYPSYIHHRRRFKKKKKDITVFFNILIDLTLKNIRTQVPKRLQTRIDTLLQRSSVIYPRFYNQSRGSYNFWRRDTAYRFPYSWWIPLIKKDGAVPDDMDDTVLARFIDPKGNKDSLEKLHQRMQAYIHQPGRKLRTALKSYRNYPTYSTWFGERFPVVLDAVVLSNILSFVCHYDLPWTAADSAALQLIVHSIRTKDYIHHPLSISPYYGQTAILLYHYSRLMQEQSLPSLDSLRPQLIQAAHNLLISNKDTDLMEKIITANALIQLGEPAPALTLPDQSEWISQVEKSDFAYFVGNIPSYMARSVQGILTGINALMYYHYCPALNEALVLQYLVTARQSTGSR